MLWRSHYDPLIGEVPLEKVAVLFTDNRVVVAGFGVDSLLDLERWMRLIDTEPRIAESAVQIIFDLDLDPVEILPPKRLRRLRVLPGGTIRTELSLEENAQVFALIQRETTAWMCLGVPNEDAWDEFLGVFGA